jgi:hypothetical protein
MIILNLIKVPKVKKGSHSFTFGRPSMNVVRKVTDSGCRLSAAAAAAAAVSIFIFP